MYTEDVLFERAVSLLKQLIATPSFSKEEHDTAVILQKFLQENNIETTNRHLNNVWAKNLYYDNSKPTLLLNSHHDTVRPNSGYTNNPFHAFEQNGRLYGLGSNDAGGCLVALLACFMHFYKRRDLKYNVVFAATAEEEISGTNGIAILLPLLGEIDMAIVGEPTQMQMAIAERGLMVVDCESKGLAGHAAREEGINAIYNCMEDIQWFMNYQFSKTSELLGPVKMTVTIINAGTQHNVVPDSCKYTVDVRVNEQYTNEEVLEVITQNVKSEVKARSMRLRSTSIDLNNPLVKAGIETGRTYFGSATLSDKVFMKCPALKIGPGDSARSHSADEFIYLNEIKEGINLYIQLLNKIL